VFFHATGDSADGDHATGRQIAALGANTVVKVPRNTRGIPSGDGANQERFEVLITAVYDPAQAATASANGASDIAPYLGRLEDSGRNGVEDIATMQRMVQGSRTRVLAASIRSPATIAAFIVVGVTHVTATPRVLMESMDNSDSNSAAALFELHAQDLDFDAINGVAANQKRGMSWRRQRLVHRKPDAPTRIKGGCRAPQLTTRIRGIASIAAATSLTALSVMTIIPVSPHNKEMSP
jgi:transaldolase